MSEDEDDGRHDACDTAHPHTPSAPIPIKSSKRGGGGSSSGTPTKGLIRTNSLHQEWLSGEQEEKRKHVGAPKKEDEEDFALSAPLSKEAAASGGEEGKRSGAGKGKKAAVEVVEELVETPREKLGPDQFELLAVIGIGAYGRVFQVKEKDSGRIYAMKVLQKGQILKKNNLRYVHEEKNILTRVDCPFVVSLMCAFQTTTKLYLVMEYLCGGELFHHLRNEGLFMEETACFYAAEIVCALEYLHSCKIIHRDLKPENVLLDAKGHVRLTDFGLATVETGDSQAKTICGTDLYMAPEMLGGNGYGRAVDWWSLGTLLFEMLTGDPPFFARDTKQLYKKIMREKPKYPRWLSSPCHSLLKGLLTRNVDQRLGAAKSTMFKTRGVQEVKSHPFFKDIDWQKLEKLEMAAPFCPKSGDQGETDVSNFDEKLTKLVPRFSDEMAPKYRSHLQRADEDAFSGFSYVRDSFLEESMKGLAIQTVDSMDTENVTKEDKDGIECTEKKSVDNSADIPLGAGDPGINNTETDETPRPSEDTTSAKPESQDLLSSTTENTVCPSAVVWPLPQEESRSEGSDVRRSAKPPAPPQKTLARSGSSYASAVSNGDHSSSTLTQSNDNVTSHYAKQSGSVASAEVEQPRCTTKQWVPNPNAKPWKPSWER